MTTINQTIEVPTADLNTYITNPRIGNTTEIAKSLTISGQYRAIVVNKGTHTGRPMEVLAGNHTLMAARDLGWDTITAHIVDVDNDQAARIVLADNRTADLGTYDNDVLASLLDDLPDLDAARIERMARAIFASNYPNLRWESMGEDTQEHYRKAARAALAAYRKEER